MIAQIQLYNTLGRNKTTFTPINPGKIGIYLCGITVYDLCHLGHARVMCSLDSIVRYLESIGYQVTLVRNITDIDDKIIHRARELGSTTEEVTAQNIAAMHQDFAALGLREPDSEPRATGYIAPIVRLITNLIDKGYAYTTPAGDVYYRVKRFASYGALSGKRIDQLQSGARVDIDPGKEDPLDFALWKAAKPGEPSWSSPWGEGRPGWHIECSAMSMQELGHDFDIHAGGPDLIFPHHENEIAQSCAAHDCNYAHYWMHAGPLRMGEDKMSKSLGNYITIRDALAGHRAEVWRVWFAMSHYRSQINFQHELVDQAARVVNRLYLRLRDCDLEVEPLTEHPQLRAFHAAMQDDFNTPLALAAIQAIGGEMATTTGEQHSRLGATMLSLARSLGLLQTAPQTWLAGEQQGDISAERITALLRQRDKARAERNFATADAIRDQLAAAGVVMEDGANGTSWRRH